MAQNKRLWAALFLSGPLFIYLVIVIVPLLSSFYFSLTDWNGFGKTYNMVGLDNFRKIISDPLFGNAIKNTIIWMVAAIIVPTVVGLSIALVLNEGVRGSNLYKSLFYLPICLSLAIVGQVWIWVYQPDWGLINEILRRLNLDQMTRGLAGQPGHRAARGDPGVVLAAGGPRHGNLPGRADCDPGRADRGS